jgi:heat shock protein beta-11
MISTDVQIIPEICQSVMASVIPMTVAYATAFDHNHPPTNVLDPSDTFWATTGLYPHEIVLRFKNPAQIARITTTTGKVRSMAVYAAPNSEFTDWVEIDATNLAAQPLSQQEIHQLNYAHTSYGVKIVVTKGWGPFAAIYLVRVEGPTVHVEEQPHPAKRPGSS